jgi:hypothetical protein
MKKKVVIYLYNRFLDPLIQGNIMQYINRIAQDTARNPYEFTIITYEDETLPVPNDKMKELRESIARGNMHWIPIKWHPGTSASKKATDLAVGLKVLAGLRLKGYRYIVSLASIAGSFAYVAARMLGMKLYLYQYEPHSEYAIDNNMWSPDSMNYKVLNRLEKKSALFARVISSGTRHMEERLQSWDVRGTFYKIPSVTNDQFFVFDRYLRKRIRDQFSIGDEKRVIVYPGKFGDLYYGVEVFYVFKWLSEAIDNVFFLIITSNDHEQIRAWIAEAGLPENICALGKATYEEMPGILSASDFGIVNVPPGPSKKFISNIKVGEYLCCGLPYLICKGISEDDWYAENKHVGVTVEDFSQTSIKAALPQVKSLLSEPKESVVERCRRTGVEYRGLSTLQNRFEQALRTLTS